MMNNQYDYYAIVTNDPMGAAKWFQERYSADIKTFVRGHMMFMMNNNDRYRIISRPEQVTGYWFVGIVMDPTYTDLLNEVKKRIR